MGRRPQRTGLPGNPARRGAAQAGRALDRIYAQVPDAGCQRRCTDSCHSLAMEPVEQARIHAETGVALPLAHAGSACPALSPEGLCTIRSKRPLVCRLFGSVNHPLMRCPYGCAPAGGLLPDATARRLLAQARRVGLTAGGE